MFSGGPAMPYVFFLVICFIWGSSFILMKKATLWLSPISVGCWRVFAGGLVLLALFWLWRQRAHVRRADWFPLLGCIVLGFAWPYCLQPEIIARHGSAFVGMTVGFTPLLTVLFSIPMLGILPTARQTVGVVGALVCLGLLMWDGVQRSIPWTDVLLAFSVPATYALTNNWIRRSLMHVPPLELTLVCLLGSGLLLLPLALAVPNTRPVVADQWAWALAAVITLGVLGTGLSTCLFMHLVQTQGPLFAGMVTNLVPIGAILWGWADHEQVTLLQVSAVLGIVAMVSLVQFGSARPRVRSVNEDALAEISEPVIAPQPQLACCPEEC